MNSTSVQKKIFKEKFSQAIELIDKPLVIFNLNGQNKNYKMFTQIDDHSAPSVFVILPDKQTHIIVSSIERALPESLKENVKIHAYSSSSGLLSKLNEIISPGSEIYVEVSSKYSILDTLTYGFYQKLKKNYNLKSAENILWELRTIKTKEEINLIKKAVSITREILCHIESDIRAGIKESEIMDKLNILVCKNKLEFSFKPIIASGKRASDPHPIRFTNKKLIKDELLIIDLGVFYCNYTSDLTRTYKVNGNIRDERYYDINKEMVEKLISLNICEITPYELALIMDDVAKKHKVLNLQKHGYGHGIGLDIHDVYPSISKRPKKDTSQIPKFSDNMVFAFEPGFYSSKKSFRIENNYIIKNGYVLEL
ncbi:MAG: aminopeptidase P family protein [Candidatus Firestonebacteria bacterium]|nr:aminopeptidase P family protein [Candidatus Firestonebacteria bacterium]